MSSTDKATPANDLIAQVKRMLEREAYHYCGDCRTHCRQTILAVEALKESERLRTAQAAAVERLYRALIAFVPLCVKCAKRAPWISSMTGARQCDEHKRDTSYIDDAVYNAIAALAAVEGKEPAS